MNRRHRAPFFTAEVVQVESLGGPAEENAMIFEEHPTTTTTTATRPEALERAMHEVELTRMEAGATVEAMLATHERAENVAQQAETLHEHASTFHRVGGRVKRRFWRRHAKLVSSIIFGVVVLLVIVAGVIAIMVVAA